MQTSIIGYPRVGAERELKTATEKFFRSEIPEAELMVMARTLRMSQWKTLQGSGLDFIPSGDFSFYDGMLDTAVLLNAVPLRYRALGLSPLATYFAMARGYQGAAGDVKALSMKKWFNTNYHYLVPELDAAADLRLSGEKPFEEFAEALALGVRTRPGLIGPFTFLKLSKFIAGSGETSSAAEKSFAAIAAPFVPAFVEAYGKALSRFAALGAEWVQLEEPALVRDLDEADLALFESLYRGILAQKGSVRVLLSTYFGDIRDGYSRVTALDFDGIGLDFVEGRQSLALVQQFGFPKDKVLFAGLVNGKNVWRNHYAETYETLAALERAGARNIVLGTSCSLLHVPYTVRPETHLPETVRARLAFAEEKLGELAALKRLALLAPEERVVEAAYLQNVALWNAASAADPEVCRKTAALSEADFTRAPGFATRTEIQKETFGLPLLPTTTIGSFPQTAEVKHTRARFRRGEISAADYDRFVRSKVRDCIVLQEQLGLDVLVHGEYERNDMVEFFGEHLAGFVFTEKAWVQSYGTRCVKPPIIAGDVSRREPITVELSSYANSLSDKPVKGMLTGPVTILNWSFPREDIPLSETTFQIALALREEVLDLEAHGLSVIQIDEAALKEKLPLRRADWNSGYLDWAIPAFRLVHAKVRPTTQIHTHMCYNEFGDIVEAIDAMDADVISFEASRSNLSLVDVLREKDFHTAVGPGVYDIHSPRVPSVEEMEETLRKILAKLPAEQVWVNPDCGLKTRGEKETVPSLRNLVSAARNVRKELSVSSRH